MASSLLACLARNGKHRSSFSNPCVSKQDFTTSTDKSSLPVNVTDPEDKVTHTGQKFEKDDYRLIRFINSPKIVNPNIAIDLINSVPPEPSKDRVVWCDGGDPSIGHPKVYINLDKPGNHTCGYCGLRFYKDGGKH